MSEYAHLCWLSSAHPDTSPPRSTALPPPPATSPSTASSLLPLATIQSLPTETLLRILNFAAIPSPSSSTAVSSTRYNTLRSAALVCRGLRAPAQALLWEQVVIYSTQSAHRFVVAAKTVRFRTPSLRIQSRTDGQIVLSERWQEVITLCTGIRRLELISLGHEETDVLADPGLAGLETLDISNTFIGGKRSAPHPFPFNLFHLTLSLGPNYAYLWTTIDLSPFLQRSLTSLHLQLSPYSLDETITKTAFIPPLVAIASQLTTLHLEANSAFLLAATPFFTSLTSLVHLTAVDPAIFPHLPTALKSWTCPLQGLLPEILEILLSPSLAVSKLERVVFSKIPEDRARKFGFWSEVVPECKRRGIECVFEGSAVEDEKGWRAVRISLQA